MEVSMSKTRRGKYTDNRICYISKCKGDMRLYLRRKGKLPCFSYLVRGKSFSFYRGNIRIIRNIPSVSLLVVVSVIVRSVSISLRTRFADTQSLSGSLIMSVTKKEDWFVHTYIYGTTISLLQTEPFGNHCSKS